MTLSRKREAAPGYDRLQDETLAATGVGAESVLDCVEPWTAMGVGMDCGVAAVDYSAAASRCIAASKARPDAGKSVRRTKARASWAPYSRSIPESSHSMESGPA